MDAFTRNANHKVGPGGIKCNCCGGHTFPGNRDGIRRMGRRREVRAALIEKD